jgi:dihydroflavonol-4-reductase
MKVCVTGTNGFLAANLIRHLLDEGYEVNGLIRRIGKLHIPGHQRFNLFIGDIHDSASMERAMKGCTYVIHAAALTDQRIPDYETYHRINTEGTLQVIEAAVKSNIKRLVYVSTANTIGHGFLTPAQETMAMSAPFNRSYYALSKQVAESYAIAVQECIETVVVNPTFMLGEYDNKPRGYNIVSMGLKRIIFCPPGGKNFVHVKDVARGIVAAMEKGENGENYLLAGENLSYAGFFTRMNRITRLKPLVITLPRWMLLAAGIAGSLLRRAGIHTAISLTNMRILCTKNYYSNTKARKHLGLTFLPVEYAIKDALYWIRKRK